MVTVVVRYDGVKRSGYMERCRSLLGLGVVLLAGVTLTPFFTPPLQPNLGNIYFL